MRFLILLILAACAARNPWVYDSISTGSSHFDAARLTYSEGSSSLRFEIVRLESGLEAFLSLMKFHFTPSSSVLVAVEAGEEKWEEELPALEGNMRLRISEGLTARIIHALQDGREVVIIVDGFQQRLEPEWFARQYKKLTGGKDFFNNESTRPT